MKNKALVKLLTLNDTSAIENIFAEGAENMVGDNYIKFFLPYYLSWLSIGIKVISSIFALIVFGLIIKYYFLIKKNDEEKQSKLDKTKKAIKICTAIAIFGTILVAILEILIGVFR